MNGKRRQSEMEETNKVLKNIIQSTIKMVKLKK